MNEDELNEKDAISMIGDIANNTADNTEQLLSINQNLNDINGHISSIDEFIIMQKEKQDKEDEQTTKEDNKKEAETRETKADTQEETVALSDIYNSLEETNAHLQAIENYNILLVFASGAILGAIIFSLFWNRVFK